MKKIILILALWFVSPAWANGLVREQFEGVRPTGMGNAFLAVADDANAIWYNPAALARVKGAHFNLFDITLGADSTATLSRFKEALFNGAYSGLVSQDQTFLRLGVKPIFIFPYFAFGLYQNAQGYFDINGLTLPNVDVFTFSDLGAVASVGLPVGDNFSVGATIRAFQRTGVDAYLSPQDLLNQLGGATPSSVLDGVYSALSSLMGMGLGVGLNLGVLMKVPLQKKGTSAQLAATAEDVGNTTFRALGSTAPPTVHMSYNFGSALVYNLDKKNTVNIAIDFRHVLDPIPISKMFHFGAEYRNKYFGVRIGAYQLYPTAGLSFEGLPHTRINFSTYAVELGNSALERSQRVYMLQADIGFNPF